MRENKVVYTWESVDEYINKIVAEGNADVECFPGSLVDEYLIYYQQSGVTEIFVERYLNEWSSGLERHIYRKKIPEDVQQWIADRRENADIYA